MPGPKDAVQSAFQESEDSKQRAKDYFMTRYAGLHGRIEEKQKKMKEKGLKNLASGKIKKTDATLTDEEFIEKGLAGAYQFSNAQNYFRNEAREQSKVVSYLGQFRLGAKETGTGRFQKKESVFKSFFKNYLINPFKNLFSKKERRVEKPAYNMEDGYFNPFAAIPTGENAQMNETVDSFKQDVLEQDRQARQNDYEAESFNDVSRDWQMLDFMTATRQAQFEGSEEEAKAQRSAWRSQNVDDLQRDIEKYAETYSENYDSMRELKPDFMAKEQQTPDKFEVVIAVEPPTEIYGSFNKQFSHEKTGRWRTIKNMMRSFFGAGIVKADKEKILDEQMRKSSEYQELYAKGEEEARRAGMTYDPDQDPNIDILRAQMAEGIANKQGHTFVRLVAKKGDKPMHGYSFGFWPLTSTYGMGGIVDGVVKNPDPDATSSELIERRHEVEYPGYVKAAAKARGVMGSQRTYSFLGYNCTSFAADVAREAGVSIKDDDTSDKVQTFKYGRQRVDSPYAIVNYIKAGMYDPNNPEAKENASELLKDMTFREQMDAETLQSFKSIAEGVDRTPTKKELQSEEKQNERKRYFDLEDKWLGQLLKNSIFELLFTTYGQGAREDIGQNDNAKAVIYGRQLIRKILSKTADLVEEIEEEVRKEKEEFLKNEQEHYDTDPITMARRLSVEKKRQKMQETFGVPTGIDFIKNACETEEGLSRAYTLLSTVKSDKGNELKFSAARQAMLSKNGTTDENTEKEKDIDENVLRKQRLDALAQNPYYLEHIAILKDEVYGSQRESMAERMLKCIEAMARKYSPTLSADERKILKESPDVVKVQMMTRKQTDSKHKLGTFDPQEFIDRVCKDPVEMKRAFDNGLQQPVILQKMKQDEGVEAIRKKAVFDGEQQEAIQKYTVDCFDKYVLEPWFQAVEKMQTLCQGSIETFKTFFFRNDEKILAFVVEYANRSWPVREKLEYFLRANMGNQNKQENRAAFMQKFLKEVFVEIEPVDKENVDDSGSGQETKELKVIKECCKAVGLYNEEGQKAAINKYSEMQRARMGA